MTKREISDVARHEGPAPLIYFLSASGKDEATARALCQMLSPASRDGRVRVTVNGDLKGGDIYEKVQKAKMEEASIIVPIVSADLFKDYERLFSPGRLSTAIVVPVKARPCLLDGQFEGCTMLPSTGYVDSDEKQAEVAQALLDMTRAMPKKVSAVSRDFTNETMSSCFDVHNFVDAIVAAFNAHSLNEVTYFELGAPLDRLVSGNDLREQAAGLHGYLVAHEKLQQFIAAARGRNPGNRLLKSYEETLARHTGYPTWIDACPMDWPNKDLQAFCDACAEAYPDPASARNMLKAAGVDVGYVSMSSQPRSLWHSALDVASRQLRLRALFDTIRNDTNNVALFASWR